MASAEERLRDLVDANLKIEGRTPGQLLDLTRNIAETGVPSPDLVARWKLVNEAFGIEIPADTFATLLTPGDLVAYLDAHTG